MSLQHKLKVIAVSFSSKDALSFSSCYMAQLQLGKQPTQRDDRRDGDEDEEEKVELGRGVLKLTMSRWPISTFLGSMVA